MSISEDCLGLILSFIFFSFLATHFILKVSPRKLLRKTQKKKTSLLKQQHRFCSSIKSTAQHSNALLFMQQGVVQISSCERAKCVHKIKIQVVRINSFFSFHFRFLVLNCAANCEGLTLRNRSVYTRHRKFPAIYV